MRVTTGLHEHRMNLWCFLFKWVVPWWLLSFVLIHDYKIYNCTSIHSFCLSHCCLNDAGMVPWMRRQEVILSESFISSKENLMISCLSCVELRCEKSLFCKRMKLQTCQNDQNISVSCSRISEENRCFLRQIFYRWVDHLSRWADEVLICWVPHLK